MSKRYEEIILRKLLSKYEGSKLSSVGSSKNIKISMKLDEKNLPEYVNEDSYIYEKEINNSINDLANRNFVSYSIKNERIDKVILNVVNIEDVYEYLGLDSPKRKREKYLEIVSRYSCGGELVSAFSGIVKDLILGYKGCAKYFNTYQELKELFVILDRLDNQKEEISRRGFSSKYLNDSKRLEVILSKVERIIRECVNSDSEDILANYNVYKNPTFVYVKGSGIVKINDQVIDLDKLSHELIMSSNHLRDLSILELSVENIITVENLTSFYDYPTDNSLVIYLGGFHNEVRRNFLLKIYSYNSNFNFYHSGDIDAGGFYILNHLINKTGINFMARNMDVQTLIEYKDYIKELSLEDRKRLGDLKQQMNMKKYMDVIDYMIDNNVKLEQENIVYK